MEEDPYIWSIDLIMTTREEILNALKKSKEELSALGIKEIGLFGSYSKNEPSEISDIDIPIDFETEKETYDNLMAAYDLMDRLFQQEKVEIITKNGLSPYIGPKILNEVIYV